MKDTGIGGSRRRFEPRPTEVTEPFWEATRRRELLIQWCIDCKKPIFYPRKRCPSCLGSDLEWRQASGRAEVYAFTVERRPEMSSLGGEEPFVVALVELEEGVRMMSNVVGCAPEEVFVGMALSLDWEPLSEGRHLPQFRPRRAG